MIVPENEMYRDFNILESLYNLGGNADNLRPIDLGRSFFIFKIKYGKLKFIIKDY
jgi:hypothetical protein